MVSRFSKLPTSTLVKSCYLVHSDTEWTAKLQKITLKWECCLTCSSQAVQQPTRNQQAECWVTAGVSCLRARDASQVWHIQRKAAEEEERFEGKELSIEKGAMPCDKWFGLLHIPRGGADSRGSHQPVSAEHALFLWTLCVTVSVRGCFIFVWKCPWLACYGWCKFITMMSLEKIVFREIMSKKRENLQWTVFFIKVIFATAVEMVSKLTFSVMDF